MPGAGQEASPTVCKAPGRAGQPGGRRGRACVHTRADPGGLRGRRDHQKARPLQRGPATPDLWPPKRGEVGTTPPDRIPRPPAPPAMPCRPHTQERGAEMRGLLVGGVSGFGLCPVPDARWPRLPPQISRGNGGTQASVEASPRPRSAHCGARGPQACPEPVTSGVPQQGARGTLQVPRALRAAGGATCPDWYATRTQTDDSSLD